MTEKKEAKQKQRFGLLGWVFLLASAASVALAGFWFFEASSQAEENNTLRDSLLDKKAELLMMGDSEYDTEYIRQMTYSAKEAGTAVADAINTAHALEWDARWVGQQPDWDAIRGVLSVVPAYFPSTYENGAAWFAGRDPLTGVRSSWEFMTTFSFTHDTIDCLWLCRRESDDMIVAYATGVYEAANGMFRFTFANDHHITTYGAAWMREIQEHSIVNDGVEVTPDVSEEPSEEASGTNDASGVTEGNDESEASAW